MNATSPPLPDSNHGDIIDVVAHREVEVVTTTSEAAMSEAVVTAQAIGNDRASLDGVVQSCKQQRCTVTITRWSF